jgi:hypothetical protein
MTQPWGRHSCLPDRLESLPHGDRILSRALPAVGRRSTMLGKTPEDKKIDDKKMALFSSLPGCIFLSSIFLSHCFQN